jgi:hypothetical protein
MGNAYPRISRDIGNACPRMSRDIGTTTWCTRQRVQSPARDHRRPARGTHASRRRARLRRLEELGIQARRPLPPARRSRLHAPLPTTHHSPQRLPDDLIERIATLRHDLTTQGLDAGPTTIAWHLATHHDTRVAPATISRHLTRLGLVEPQPKKRPRSSYIRFQAAMPNQTWQSDITHYRLTTGTEAKILTWLDDCSRYALSVTAHHPRHRPRRPHLLPPRHRHPRHPSLHPHRQRHGLHHPLRRRQRRPQRPRKRAPPPQRHPEERPTQPPHHLRQGRTLPTDPQELAPRPNHPPRHTRSPTSPTRRLHDHLQPPPPPPLPTAPRDPRLDLHHHPKASPTSGREHDTHDRVRSDTIDKAGVVTLRVNGRLHHIGVGRHHAHQRVILLVQDQDIRIVDTTTGELLRHLTLDPTRDYQPTGQPKGPKPKTKRTKP